MIWIWVLNEVWMRTMTGTRYMNPRMKMRLVLPAFQISRPARSGFLPGLSRLSSRCAEIFFHRFAHPPPAYFFVKAGRAMIRKAMLKRMMKTSRNTEFTAAWPRRWPMNAVL